MRDLKEETERFLRALEDEAMTEGHLEPLIDRHMDFRTTSARALRDITDFHLSQGEWALDGVIVRLEAALRARLSIVLPPELIRIRHFGATHRKLYEYLHRRRGTAVSGARLRVLTGDQVHTERRLRELRDIGLEIPASREGGQNVYTLGSSEFDTDVAISRVAESLVASVPGWDPQQRARALERIKSV